jgi:hypothetical protein
MAEQSGENQHGNKKSLDVPLFAHPGRLDLLKLALQDGNRNTKTRPCETQHDEATVARAAFLT